jgi:cupin fold WbuC family metalloprotein
MHETHADPIQRLLIASMRDSYFRPHRHPDRWESALVISGSFDVFLYDDSGRILERTTLGPNHETIGFETPANTWHSLLTQEDASVFFSLKQGPFEPQIFSEFALWSPEEGSPVNGKIKVYQKWE